VKKIAFLLLAGSVVGVSPAGAAGTIVEFRGTPHVITAVPDSGSDDQEPTAQTCTIKADAAGGTFDGPIHAPVTGTISSTGSTLPAGGHFEIVADTEVGFDIDAATGEFVLLTYAPGSYSATMSYVADVDGAFETCSTTRQFTASWGAPTHTFDAYQCYPSNNGYVVAGTTYKNFGTLPAGLELDATGQIVGYATAAPGTYGPYVQLGYTGGALAGVGGIANIRVISLGDIFVQQPVPAVVGSVYVINFGVQNSYSSDWTYTFSPALPSWLTLRPDLNPQAAGYQFEGVPTQSGSFTTTATLRNFCGDTMSQTITVNVD
jgi:hypothetical protein